MTKYGVQNRDAILTEIFDYIRCANAIDTTSMSTTAFTTGTDGQGESRAIRAPRDDHALEGGLGRGRCQPRHGPLSHGLGSHSRLLLCRALVDISSTNDPTKVGTSFANPTIAIDPITKYPTHRRYRAFLLLSTFDPMQGYAPTANPASATTPLIGVTVAGLDSMS